MTFQIGCAVWAYKGWLGELFPAGSRSTEFLQLYSRRFSTVEGNTTFYSIPDANTVARWAAETPPGFEFCLKLPKALTHEGLLQPRIAETNQFLERMRGLQDRLGPFLVQLPPGYGPDRLADLTAFLTALSQDTGEFALEVRHPDWFTDPHTQRLNDRLKALGIGRVLLDSRPIYEATDDPQQHSQRPKPNLPVQPSITATFSLIRFISHPNLECNQPFLDQWVSWVDQWLRQGSRVYFFVHCPLEARSPSNARYFQQLLEQNGSPVSPLPWNTLEAAPSQLTLF